MTRLLLDHPWPIDAALDARSDGFQVLLKFDELIRRRDLPLPVSPVPFVEAQEYYEALQRLRGRSASAATVRRFSYHLIRNGDSVIRATPIPEPNPPLSDCWKRALRDELEYLENWRNPQIIFPEKRRADWPQNTSEVPIQCEDREGTVSRVLASLEEYDSHPFAVPDMDPWRHLEWLKRPEPSARIDHPCRLPKPPILEGVPVEQLFQRLGAARAAGWNVNGRYYFIPPANCRPELVAKPDWRKGHAFELKTKDTKKGKKTGPIDWEGRVWAWDMVAKRHWDVQLPDGTHMNISHNGCLL